jgi:hypothetical protein
MWGPTSPDTELGGCGAGGKERGEEWAAEDGRGGHSKTSGLFFPFYFFFLLFSCASFFWYIFGTE